MMISPRRSSVGAHRLPMRGRDQPRPGLGVQNSLIFDTLEEATNYLTDRRACTLDLHRDSPIAVEKEHIE